MDELDIKITRIMKNNYFEMSSKYQNLVNETLLNLPEKKLHKNSFKMIFATVCCSILLITGIVFAKQIEEAIHYKFSIGQGVDTAIKNGNIAEPKMEFIEDTMVMTDAKTGEYIDNIPMKVKLESAFMDDDRIAVELAFEFDIKIDEYVNLGKLSSEGYIDYENSHYTEITDLVVMDEENRLLGCNKDREDDYYNYCKKHQIKTSEFKPYGLVAGTSMGEESVYRDDKTLKLTLESLIGVSKEYIVGKSKPDFPHSKKICVSFSEIHLTPKLLGPGNEVYLKSEKGFEFETEFPKEIYERTDIIYEQTKSERENVKVIGGKLSNSNFLVAFEINGVEYPEYPARMVEIESQGPINEKAETYEERYGEEYAKLYREYYNKVDMIRINGSSRGEPYKKSDGCYVLNANGKRFDWEGQKRGEYVNGESRYCGYLTFTMTKYDATDEVVFVLDLYGEPVKIYLKKIE